MDKLKLTGKSFDSIRILINEDVDMSGEIFKNYINFNIITNVPHLDHPGNIDKFCYPYMSLIFNSIPLNLICEVSENKQLFKLIALMRLKIQQFMFCYREANIVACLSSLKTLIEINSWIVENSNEGFLNLDIKKLKTTVGNNIKLIEKNCHNLIKPYKELCSYLNCKNNIILFANLPPSELGDILTHKEYKTLIFKTINLLSEELWISLHNILEEKSDNISSKLSEIRNIFLSSYIDNKNKDLIFVKDIDDKELEDYVNKENLWREHELYVKKPNILKYDNLPLQYKNTILKMKNLAYSCNQIYSNSSKINKKAWILSNHLLDISNLRDIMVPDIASNFDYLKKLYLKHDLEFNTDVKFRNINSLRHFNHKYIPQVMTFENGSYGDDDFTKNLFKDCENIIIDLYNDILKDNDQ